MTVPITTITALVAVSFSSSLSINLCSPLLCRESLLRSFYCFITPILLEPFSPTSFAFALRHSFPYPSLSWKGHTLGCNESTHQCLQEASFHRPSWITVTMEISATTVTGTLVQMWSSRLLRQQMDSFWKIFTVSNAAPQGQLGPPTTP